MHILHRFLQPKPLFAFVLALYAIFGSSHLTKFVTADEHYWVEERIPQYWKAIAEHRWTKTFINDKPGVSLALISGIGYAINQDSPSHCKETDDKVVNCRTLETQSLYFAFRLPILITNGLLLIFLFFLVSKVTDPWIALWTLVLTALAPILLGISQIINPDSLLWSFGMVGIFSFLAFLETSRYRYVILTTIATGFALLSKYVAVALLPFYCLLAGVFLILKKDTPSPGSIRKEVFLLATVIATIATGSIALLCLFLPALVLNDKYISLFLGTIPHKGLFLTLGALPLLLIVIDTLFLKNILILKTRTFFREHPSLLRLIPLSFFLLIMTAIALRIGFPSLEMFTYIPFDMKDFENDRYYGVSLQLSEMFLLEWNPILFSLTPITLIGVLIFLYQSFTGHTSQKNFLFATAFPLITILYLILFLAAGILVTPRYSILLYTPFAFLAALGYARIIGEDWLARILFTAIILAASIASLVSIQPFYFNYSSFLLPKGALISDSWGYGGYEAAEYLNTLPNATDLTVWSDYYGVCEFLVGKCLTAYTFDGTRIRPDYYVLTRRGKIRYMSRYDRWEQKSGLTAYQYYDRSDPVWSLEIDDRLGNYVKVFKVEK